MLSSAGQALAEGRITVLDRRRLRLLAVWVAMSVSKCSWPAVETAKAFLRGEVDLHALAHAGEQARSGVAGASMNRSGRSA
jgi:hypothetical protein